MSSRIGQVQTSNLFAPTGGVDEYHDAARLETKRVQSASDVWVEGDDLIKRPGRRLWSSRFATDRPFRGVREYVDADGGVHLVVAHGGSLYEATPSANTQLAGFNDDEPLHMHAQRGKLFVYGSATQRKVVKSTASEVGLAKPTEVPIVDFGGSGGLTGSYAYKVTFVIETSGAREYESDPSDVSNSISASSQKLVLTYVPTSTDSRVNARYIYRTTADGANYYYVGKISDNTTTAYSDNLADASIGSEVETNHDQPEQAEYACGCNERQLWLKGDKLRWSEMAVTVAYLEYQKPTSYQELPGTGKGLGIAAVYNATNNSDDAYVFQEDAISILPGGDPTTALRVLRRGIGGYHDTIAEYQSRLVFLSTQRSVCMIADNRVIDISSRSIPTSLKQAINLNQAKGAVIFGHYYALTVQTDYGNLYNNTTWVCDLDTVTEVKSGVADARWYPWTVDVDYWIQRQDGTVLAFDNNTKRVWEYTTDEFSDESAAGGTFTAFSGWVRTPDFVFDNLLWLKKVFSLALHGQFHEPLTVTPYGMRGASLDAVAIAPVAAAFVAGQSKAGQPVSKLTDFLEAAMPEEMAGVNMFSFKIAGEATDPAFRLNGYQFTYMQFARGL